MNSYRIDELITVCIARQVQDGEVLAQGINTPLVMAGYILAKCTHAPKATFATAIAPGLAEQWKPLGIATAEANWLESALTVNGFDTAVGELLPRYQPKEFFRPAQLQADGCFNNIAIGKDYQRPRMRLPGTGGIPDVTTYSEQVYLYVPQHSRVTFVPQVDFISGLGHVPQRKRGKGPVYLVSNLGQFDWAEGKMRLTHLHSGITLEQVQQKTGFPLAIAPDLQETPPPTAEELRLLREDIDPLNVRALETLSGSARKDLLRNILHHEGVLHSRGNDPLV
jgi:acyl CoA:acetate/3-ketoacid CoA transferase beta subunit